jgi:hypothetical protein
VVPKTDADRLMVNMYGEKPVRIYDRYAARNDQDAGFCCRREALLRCQSAFNLTPYLECAPVGGKIGLRN